jgi:tight adherence protein B
VNFAILLAAAAGALAAPALTALAESAVRVSATSAAPLAQVMSDWSGRVLRPVRRARIEGAEATGKELRRLQVSAALVGLAVGGSLAGFKAGVAIAAASCWFASRLLVWYRGRYRRRLDQGASAAALALADALAAGQSVRGALVICGNGLGGPIAAELRKVGKELELGAETDHALDRLRLASRSRRVDMIVAAIRVQRRSGGRLAALLRGIATTLEEHDRLDGEARATIAQARFTAVVVLLLPLAGLLLAALSAPGIVGRMTGSPAGVWLLSTATLLQLSGIALIKRLTRLDG